MTVVQPGGMFYQSNSQGGFRIRPGRLGVSYLMPDDSTRKVFEADITSRTQNHIQAQ